MQPIDFSGLLDAKKAAVVLPANAQLSYDAYGAEDGVQFKCADANEDQLIQEIVRIDEEAFLLATDCSARSERTHLQVVSRSDWVHIQFRLAGGGRERVARADTIETPDNCCIIARYPKNALIERCLDKAERWRAVCLLMTPTALIQLLGAPTSSLPGAIQWLTSSDSGEQLSKTIPLHSGFALAGNDILSCSLRGRTRHMYMRAKFQELLSIVLDALERRAAGERRASVKLSAADLHRIAQARMIMIEDLDCPMTLAQLARAVGLNRTKLALGFKHVHGSSVQVFWRDIRLSRARALLQENGARVTDVALRMGYSELSSFTRAFNRKFGILPRDCKDAVDRYGDSR